jgi:excisionase family DNA binding protein
MQTEASMAAIENPIPEVTGGRLLLTPSEAASALAVSRRTLWSLTNAGLVPSLRIGRCVRYSIPDLKSWIEANMGRPQRSR